MSDAIYVKDLIKEYNTGRVSKEKRLALNGLNINIEVGSIFGLLGPNGAGKSTLINILAGTVIKTSGEVRVMGVDIDKQPKKARSLIGIVPQEIVTDTFFPLWQALEFTAGYFGIKPENRITDQLLKTLSLYDKRNSLPQRLSGGMKRRFLIAKAMVHSPKILVLDEPTAGVDPISRRDFWDLLYRQVARGVTVFVTTHYMDEAEHCHRLAFIQRAAEDIMLQIGSDVFDIG